MNYKHLAVARKKLAFSEDQAATMIGPAAGFMLSAAQWRAMETGEFPLPEQLGAVVQQLLQWQERALTECTRQIADLQRMHGKSSKVALIEYLSLDDWATLVDRDPLLWRPQCSVVHSMSKDKRVRIVPFNGPAYAKWLKDRIDGEDMRAAWAAEQ